MILEPEDTDENRILDQLEYTLSQAQKADADHIAFFDNRLRAQFDRQLYVLEQIKKRWKISLFRYISSLCIIAGSMASPLPNRCCGFLMNRAVSSLPANLSRWQNRTV